MTKLDKEIDNDDTFADMDIDIDFGDEIEKDNNNSLKKNQYYIYAIIDKDIDGLTQYFRDYGINLSKVFTNIESARNTLIMQTEPTKLIIIDTGSGKFASMSARRSLVDLIGIEDENSDIIVFYSDTVLKNEVSYSTDISEKNIKWVKFKSNPQVLATILQNKNEDEYIIDPEFADIKELKFTVESKGIKDKGYKEVNIGNIQLNINDISRLVAYDSEEVLDNKYKALEAYKVEV